MKHKLNSLLHSLNNPALPGIDLSLDRMMQLLTALSNPHERMPPAIHIAGTNGKGSTLAFLKAIYETAGYTVHAYTSPHLVQFNERIVLAGKEIEDDILLGYLEQVAVAAKTTPVTFFEATTAAAFLAFADHPADVLLLEVGMGGRLDATNVITRPLASVITPIGMDHSEFLGDTLEKIVAEKAGIIKSDVPVIVGSQKPDALAVIERVATEKNARLIRQDTRISLPQPSLAGRHQIGNAALAATVAQHLATYLPVDEHAICRGVAGAEWPARLQRLTRGPLCDAWDGPVYLDGGHNPDAATVLAEWVLKQLQPVHGIIGMMQRKDASAFLEILAPRLQSLACVNIAGHADAYSAETLARKAGSKAIAADSPLAAAHALGAKASGVLLVTGSLYLAGQVLKTHA